MWLPPPLLRWLPPGLLARWLEGRQPLALPLLGAAADNALWAGLARPLQSKAAARSLKAALWSEAQADAAATSAATSEALPSARVARRDSAAAWLAIRLMAAYQELFEDARRRQQQEKAAA